MATYSKKTLDRAPVFPKVSRPWVQLLNSWYGNPDPLSLDLDAANIQLIPVQAEDLSFDGEPLSFVLRGPKGQLVFQIENDLLSTLFGKLPQKVKPADVDASDQALLLEYILNKPLEAFEAKFGGPVQVSFWNKPLRMNMQEVLAASISIEGIEQAFACLVGCAQENAPFWQSALDQRPEPKPNAKVQESVWVPLSLQIGIVEITLGDLKNLDTGDIVLLDGAERGENLQVCAAFSHIWPAMRARKGIKLTGAATTLLSKIGAVESNRMSKMSKSTAGASVDDIPVNIAFEVGRKDVSVRELNQLREGTIVEFQDQKGKQVQIVVTGREVGWGSLVQVGESMGVKVERIFTNV